MKGVSFSSVVEESQDSWGSAVAELAHDWDMSWQNWSSTISEEMDGITRSEHYPFIARVLHHVDPGGLVLDAGSGLGRWVFFAAQMGYRAYGIDLSEKALAISQKYASENGLASQFLMSDLRVQPISTGSFNCVFSLGAIEHFPETAIAIKEFYRILRSQGRCFVTTPNTFSFHGAIGYKILALMKNRRLGYLGYEDTYTPKALARMMREAGFTGVESGIVPTEFLFGVFYANIPMIGRRLQNLLGKISYLIESRQAILGFMSYAVGCKPS